MLTVEEALQAILARIDTPLSTERVGLGEARGRVLAEDVRADMDSPPFTNSAVDGFAVRVEDTSGASTNTPISLRVVADIPAGVVPSQPITPGTAARIMTGAVVPDGANAIVMVEDTQEAADRTVTILETARMEQHIRPAGQDVRRGAIVLPSGTHLRAYDIGLLATAGREHVSVVRLPRVAVVSTGDEVVDVSEGELPAPGKIRNSNRHGLAALVEEFGGIVSATPHLTDDLEATIAAFQAMTTPPVETDVIITAGGVSVGDRDFVKPALERLGTLDLWRVAMKPGKPLAFGSIGSTLFFGLPGNPVSVLVTFLLFVRPALWKLSGRPDNALALPEIEATLTEEISHQPGRREYVRTVTTTANGHFLTGTTGAQGSNLLSSLTRANSLLIVPEESEGLSAGDRVRVLMLP